MNSPFIQKTVRSVVAISGDTLEAGVKKMKLRKASSAIDTEVTKELKIYLVEDEVEFYKRLWRRIEQFIIDNDLKNEFAKVLES